MNERGLALFASGNALASITIQHVSAAVSIVAGILAAAAALPVVIDRWRHVLPAWLTRWVPARSEK